MKPRRRPSNGCSPPRAPKRLQTYADVVASYLSNDQARGDDDLRWFADQPDFATTLELAVLSRTRRGKRHRHQCRIPAESLRKAHRVLARCELEACKSFDDLHGTIDAATSKVPKIGPLAVYDFACRIGTRLKLLPTRIHLHSGTRHGAAAMGLGRGRDTITVRELPEDFHCLSARHAEDCLCIYKDELKQIASRTAR